MHELYHEDWYEICDQLEEQGNTELAEQAANDDVLLIYDTSATEIKKIQKSNIATSLTYSAGAFTGDGSDTTFTLSAAPANENNTQS